MKSIAKTEQKKILIMGLDNSGKTSIILSLERSSQFALLLLFKTYFRS